MMKTPVRLEELKEDVGAMTRRGAVRRRGRKKPPVGSGKRFTALRRALAAKGARNPGALAAWIGRKKFGATRFARLSAAGRRRAS
jgi:hypothetical protein